MAARRTDMRERILDVALELFNAQGYDATSLREIAERLGVTKAALYYHFKSKGDILLELHLRLHDLGGDLLAELDALPDDQVVVAWPGLVDRFIDSVMANRELFLLHQRNRRAFEQIADDPRHHQANEDVEERFRRLLGSEAIPLAARVRMVCSVGAVFIGLMDPDALFGDEPKERIAELVRETVHELF